MLRSIMDGEAITLGGLLLTAWEYRVRLAR
jgi:hypothetical protein